jgi:hypothetical protein
MKKREKMLFRVIGKGPFAGIYGETMAVSSREAIKNIAHREGIIGADLYHYFCSHVEVKIIPPQSSTYKNSRYEDFKKWIERRKD